MKSVNCVTSHCGRCRFYTPTGRRGGECAQLGVPVKANWKACQLACSPFEADSFNTANFLPDNTASFLPDLDPLAPKILTSKTLTEFDILETCPSPKSLAGQSRRHSVV
ncbi:MAG: hypothetical protein AAGF01_00880 [Cyanobacteria bacterium P01_G01_bin.38]